MFFKILKALVILSITLTCIYGHADEIEIHPDEKPYLDAIIKRLGIDREKMVRSNNYDRKEKKIRSEYYKNFGDFKNLYYYDHKPYQTISLRTNIDDRIVNLEILKTNLADLKEIRRFTNLKWLNIHSTDIRSLVGVSDLKDLKRLDLMNNKDLKSLSPISNLSNLRVINTIGSSNIDDISGLNKLPNLEEFNCISCRLSDISSLSKIKSLVHLELGGPLEDISPLSSLANLKVLKIRSENLKDVDSINKLISLKKIDLDNANVNKINFKNELPKLEEIRFSRVSLKEMPDLSKTPNLKLFSVYGSEINKVDEGSIPSSLEKLLFEEVRTLRSIPKIENMPKLEELRLSGTGVKSVDLGYLPNLKVLRLSDTEITQLGDFSGLPNLEEIWLFDTKVKSLEPLLDAPKLWIVSLNHTAKNIPNARLVKQAISLNRKNLYRKPEDQVPTREVYEQLLKEHQDSKPGGSRRRSR
jgi:hypothetical protein